MSDKTLELKSMNDILEKLGEKFKLSELQQELIQNNYPDISTENIKTIIEALSRHYEHYFDDATTTLDEEIKLIELQDFRNELDTGYWTGIDPNIAIPVGCRKPYQVICHLLAKRLDNVIENKFGTYELTEIKSEAKIQLDIDLSVFLVIQKALIQHNVMSTTEYGISTLLKDRFVKKDGNPISDSSVRTMYSKGISNKIYTDAKKILYDIADQL